MSVHRSRAARRCARALELAAHPRRTARAQPARRLRAARRRRRGRSPRASTAAPAAARRGRRAAEAGDARPRRHRRGDPRAVQPHRPHRPVRAGAGRRRRTPGGLRPARPQPGRRRRRRRRCAPPASRSSTGLLADEARALNRAWTFAVEHGRPFVTWKFATTLDGRSAAADGTSRWVSSAGGPARHPPAARAVRHDAGRHQHRRGRRPAADRPRRARPAASRRQPLRAVMGERDLDPGRRIFDDARRDACTCAPATRTTALDDAVRPRPPARLPRGRPDAGRRVPRGPGWSTRSSPTSPRCCSAPAAARSATWASPPSPTRCRLTVTDVTVLGDRRTTAQRRPTSGSP